MGEVTHRFVESNGLKIHIAEQGSGPLVLLLHGFPETWYSWRHQLPALAQAGFHAVAPDIRGFGDTKGPESPEEYTALHQVGDLIGLADALNEKQFFVVGHDWGAAHAWDLCLLRPDRVKAVVTLSVPFFPRSPDGSFLDTYRHITGEGFYMYRYQKKGLVEGIYERLGYERILKGLFLAHPVFIHEDKPEVEEFTNEGPEELPSWFTKEDLAHYVEAFNKTGFTTPLNIYRAIQRTWELKAPWTNAGIPDTPALTIIGDRDLVYDFPMMKEFVHGGAFKALVPKLKETIVVEGAAHFIQQERHETVSAEIIKFFKEQNQAKCEPLALPLAPPAQVEQPDNPNVSEHSRMVRKIAEIGHFTNCTFNFRLVGCRKFLMPAFLNFDCRLCSF